MSEPHSYTGGTITVTNGSTAVTGSLTAWASSVLPGDEIVIGATRGIVETVNSNTSITLNAAWSGSTYTGAAYIIAYRSALRHDVTRLSLLYARWQREGTNYISTTGKPDNSVGNDGWVAFDLAARTFYQNVGGVWDNGTSFGTVAATTDGTAAAPSISFISDPNTGLYRYGSDAIGFSTGGALRLSVGNNGVALASNLFAPGVTPWTNFWATPGASNSLAIGTSLGYIGTNGSNKFGLYFNGYRNTSTAWTSLAVGGSAAACSIEMGSSGIDFCGDYTVSGVGPSIRMRLSPGGSLSIGHTSPAGPLDVNGSTGRIYFGADGRTIAFTANNNNYVSATAGTSANLNLVSGGHTIISAGGSERVRVQYTNGYVGIGDPAPSQPLTVSGNILARSESNYQPQFQVQHFGSTLGYFNLAKANGTIASPTDVAASDNIGTVVWQGWKNGGMRNAASISSTVDAVATNVVSGRIDIQVTNAGGTTTNCIVCKGDGTIGMGGVTVTTAALHHSGSVRFQSFGAGTAQFDASGNVSSSSDERLKEAIEPFERGLVDIAKLEPISFNWNAASGLDRLNRYSGFSAQNVETAIPEAIGENADGYLSLQERPIIAALVNAVKELKTLNDQLVARIAALEGA